MSQGQNSLDSAEKSQLLEEISMLQSKLSVSEGRWEKAMEHIEDAVLALDTQSRYVFVNRKWCEITGYSAQEVLGKNMIDVLVTPEERPFVRLMIGQLLQGEATSPCIRHIIDKQGKIRILRVVSAPTRDDQSRITGTIAFFYDITVEKDIERIKDELLSSTAHELRTPITAIQGITQSILRAIQQGSSLPPAALTKRLQVIQNANDRLALLANSLGDVAKLQDVGYVVLPRKRHNLNDIVMAVIEQKKDLAHVTSFTWDIALSPTPLPVFVNEGRIERALGNVLENALKYSLPDGTITIKTQHDGKCATVVIADQGTGILEVEIAKITDAFYKASNTTSSNYGGIGLGLFFTKTIISAHNGTLHFTSKVGHGTTVTIELPLIG